MRLLNKFETKVNESNYDYTKCGKINLFIPILFTIIAFIVFSFAGLSFTRDFTNSYEITVKYSTSVEDKTRNEYKDTVEDILSKAGIKHYNLTVSNSSTYTTLTYNYLALSGKSSSDMVSLGKTVASNIKETLDFTDYNVSYSDVITPKYDSSVLGNIALCLGVALIGIVIYLLVRFDLSSFFAIMIDYLMNMFVLFGIFSIFRLPISISIYAVVFATTIIALFRTIMLFAKVRENINDYTTDNSTNSEIISRSISQSMIREVYTTIVLILTLFAIMCIPLNNIKFTTLAIIIWLVLSFGVTYFVTPYIWSKMYKRSQDKRLKKYQTKKSQPKTEEPHNETDEIV